MKIYETENTIHLSCYILLHSGIEYIFTLFQQNSTVLNDTNAVKFRQLGNMAVQQYNDVNTAYLSTDVTSRTSHVAVGDTNTK